MVSAQSYGTRVELTIVLLPSLHEPRADTHEKHALIGVLGVELGNRHVQSSLADSVGDGGVDLVLGDQVGVRLAGADGGYLLRRPLENEWDIGVVEVDVADYIDAEVLQSAVSEFQWLLSTSYRE